MGWFPPPPARSAVKGGIVMSPIIGRRAFNAGIAATAGLGLAGRAPSALAQAAYRGPNVVLVRFGGGVRRRETIDPDHTYAPFLAHTLAARGTLFRDMRIQSLEDIVTSHGQGTLYTLTGRYDRYEDIAGAAFKERYEPGAPTLFEYLRRAWNVPAHRTLLINGEDRTDEEFFTFSNHHLFGIAYRSQVLSLYRFKTHLLRRQVARTPPDDPGFAKLSEELSKLESLDYRQTAGQPQSPEIEAYWDRWQRFYGESGFVNPRGDTLLTELAVRAIRELRPKLMMINYQDPDYVHWGVASHYTRGISIIDQGLQRLVAAIEADPEYRDNTVFVIVPDCGRDDNRLMAVPFQHHFNSRAAHEIWALMFGPGIARGDVVDRPVDQISVAATIGRVMGFDTEFAEGPILAEAFA
ncbi:MAG: hypothetical protein HKM95_01870 [Inquilinus sp.]|nr:hypothetical protein [Inquilinus sp.]